MTGVMAVKLSTEGAIVLGYRSGGGQQRFSKGQTVI
jgi:hypothetical protein